MYLRSEYTDSMLENSPHYLRRKIDIEYSQCSLPFAILTLLHGDFVFSLELPPHVAQYSDVVVVKIQLAPVVKGEYLLDLIYSGKHTSYDLSL